MIRQKIGPQENLYNLHLMGTPRGLGYCDAMTSSLGAPVSLPTRLFLGIWPAS